MSGTFSQLALPALAGWASWGMEYGSQAITLSVGGVLGDFNLDGIVDAAAGDRVWIYFGMRRGGSTYYALDVTDRDNPRLRWKIGPSELPGIGETWSAPAIARVRVNGATQNGENLVLIFGGFLVTQRMLAMFKKKT